MSVFPNEEHLHHISFEAPEHLGLFFLHISLNQEKALKHVYCQINSNWLATIIQKYYSRF